jgi:hypothetical protein
MQVMHRALRLAITSGDPTPFDALELRIDYSIKWQHFAPRAAETKTAKALRHLLEPFHFIHNLYHQNGGL